MMFTQPSASLRRVSILAIDKVFASTLMQAKDFFHLASLRYSKQLGLGLQPMFEICLVSPDGKPVDSFSNVQVPVDSGLVDADVIILPAFWEDFDNLQQRYPRSCPGYASSMPAVRCCAARPVVCSGWQRQACSMARRQLRTGASSTASQSASPMSG